MHIAVLSDLPAAKDIPERTVILRDITATEELGIRSAEAMVETLAVGGTVPVDALTLADMDMCTVALYRALYGETVVCHVPCRHCDRAFETGFELTDWLTSLREGPEVVRRGDNVYEMPGGASFRLPTRRDLEGLSSRDGEDHLRRCCLLDGNPDHLDLEAAMMRAGPLLDDDIEATCPHCGAEQRFHMRLADYLMAALDRERPITMREIHHIASQYRWSRAEIMTLPRQERRALVRLILSDLRVREVAAWR